MTVCPHLRPSAEALIRVRGGWGRKRIHPRHPPLPRLPPSPRLWRTSRRASKAVGVWQAEQGKVVGGLGRNGLPSWHAAPVACGYTDRRGTGAPRYEGPFWRHPGAEAPEPVRKRRGALTLRGQRGRAPCLAPWFFIMIDACTPLRLTFPE